MRRLPAEWEPQSAILLTWPHEGTDWAPQLAATEDVYIRLCYQVSAAGERLLIVCRDGTHRLQVERRLGLAGIRRESLVFALADSNDSWTRDHGPLICIEGPRLSASWIFASTAGAEDFPPRWTTASPSLCSSKVYSAMRTC